MSFELCSLVSEEEEHAKVTGRSRAWEELWTDWETMRIYREIAERGRERWREMAMSREERAKER